MAVVQAEVFRSLATALEAGQSLEVVLSSPPTRSAWPAPLREALVSASGHGRVGEALVEAGLLDEGAAAIVDAGILGGFVPAALRQVAELLDERRRRRRRLALVMAYPLSVLVAACVVLPLPMLVTGGVAAWAGVAVPGVVCVVAIVVVLFVVVPALPPRRQAWLRDLWARVPVVGVLVVDDARAMALGVLSRVVSAGLSWRIALPVAARASGLSRLGAQAPRALAVVDAGGTLVAALAASSLVTEAEQGLVAVAEQTGTLPERLSVLSHELTERSRRRFLAIAAVVGTGVFIVVAAVIAVQIVKGFAASFEALDAMTR
jgi:type II secretory pathway component PulF